MRHITQLVALSMLVIMTALLRGGGPAAAQVQTCQFTISLPGPQTSTFTISTAGVYCLMTDVNMAASFTSGNAIEIAANNVVLDLNGHKVGGQAAGPGTSAIGIYAFQRKNITINNGTVRGFYAGIFLEDMLSLTVSRGHRVEGVRAEGNTSTGIWVMGRGTVVRGNQVVSTGGAAINAWGLRSAGPGARILDNDVIETVSGPPPFGIELVLASGSVVKGNRVGNQVQANPSVGVSLSDSTNVLIADNRFLGWSYGVNVVVGSSGKCRDNFFANVTTPLSDCTDVANNN